MSTSSRTPRVLLVGHWDWVLAHFRLPLARALRSEGYEVTFVCPSGKDVPRLLDQGFRWIEWKRLRRRSGNPFREVAAVWALAKVYAAERPDLVNHFTIKPNLYGPIAVRLAQRLRWVRSWKPAMVNTFTGLGYVFSSGYRARAARAVILPILRLSMSDPRLITVFQNHADRQRLIDARVVDRGRCSVIAGTGVDLTAFTPRDSPPPEPIRAMTACRLIWDKGVGVLVEAGRLLRLRGTDVELILAGVPDPGNPASIPEDQVLTWHKQGLVRWLGEIQDIAGLLKTCHIAVLPTFYNEGVPRFLLEGAAMGLPLVTTDLEGCRMIARHDENAIIVGLKDARTLADAIERLAHDPALRERLGGAARLTVERDFDERQIFRAWVEVYSAALKRSEEADPSRCSWGETRSST